MNIELPEVNYVITTIQKVNSEYDKVSKPISEWVGDHRQQINNNAAVISRKSDKNDVKILMILLSDLLMRFMQGDSGVKIRKALERNLKTKDDLTREKYLQILREAQYRWVDDGVNVMDSVVNYFGKELKWNWRTYFSDAERYHKTNFIEDHLLKIKHIKYKVRDLALSNFNPNYIANDLHIVRVSTRLGLLNYGFDLLSSPNFEMGNNPSNLKNYLFLHSLFLKLSEMTDNKWCLSDFDRSFWHFGRTICNNVPQCAACPIRKVCLTGKIMTK